MSEIDCYKHIHLGDLAELSLYVLTQEVPAGAIEKHFNLTEQDIILGDGSGGPAAAQFNVLQVLQRYVSHMMYSNFDDDTMEFEDWVKGEAFPGVLFSDLDAADDILCIYNGDRMSYGDYAAWGGDQWFSFMNEALTGKTVNTPYKVNEYGGIEGWIEYSLGEFLLVNHLDFILSFVEEDLEEKLKTLKDYVTENPSFNNVKQIS